MSCKVGNKAHHDRCQKYKTRGQREINKEKKQERNQRRIAKFAARRAKKEKEAKKVYEPRDPETRGDNKIPKLGDFAYRPKMKHMTEFSAWTSLMRRVQNQLDKEIIEMKKALELTNKKKGKKNNEDKKIE